MKLTSSQLRKIIKEEVMASMGSKDSQRFLHGYESGQPVDDEGYMLKRRMLSLTKMAKDVCNIIDEHDQFPAWVQDLVASAHNDMRHISDYLLGDEMLRNSRQESFAESKKSTKQKLTEAHARITTEEMNAWMKGDWGYSSETDLEESQELDVD